MKGTRIVSRYGQMGGLAWQENVLDWYNDSLAHYFVAEHAFLQDGTASGPVRYPCEGWAQFIDRLWQARLG